MTIFFSNKKIRKKSITNKGFTLIELIVSIGLFSVVSTLAVGSILVLVDNNRALRSEQSTITNVSFALDAMTRDIRMGYNYYCESSSFLVFNVPGNDSVQDCTNGNEGISFVEGSAVTTLGTEVRRAYYYDGDTVYRKLGTNTPEAIISSSINVVDFDMYVSGTSDEQPVVTIYMRVRSESGQEYDFQTSVTQRFLNINI